MMNDRTITWPRTTFVSRTTPAPIEDTLEEISYRLKCSHGNPPQDYCGDGTKNPKSAKSRPLNLRQEPCAETRNGTYSEIGIPKMKRNIISVPTVRSAIRPSSASLIPGRGNTAHHRHDGPA